MLDGHELADADGFEVPLVDDWVPANATLDVLSAAVYADPYLPGDPAGEAMNDHVWPANAYDLAHSDAEHDTFARADEAARSAELASTDEDTGSTAGSSASRLGAAALALVVPAGVLVTRRR